MTPRREQAPGRGRAPAWLGAALAALPLGCTLLEKHEQRKIPQLGVIDPSLPRELEKVSLPAHVVEPPDELQIAVRPAALGFGNRSVTVQPDGQIDLEFFGSVYVTGLTLDQIEQKLAELLGLYAAGQQIRDPVQVSVQLLDGRNSRRYYVLGAVATASSFPLLGNETVLDGILQAGLRSNSVPEKAYLVRPHPAGGAEQVYRIDWIGITQRGDTLTNYQLMPGDRIYVPGTRPPSLIQSLLRGG